MKDFPSKCKPENISKFLEYREKREICKLKQQVYEFMLTKTFVNGKERGFDLTSYANLISKEGIQQVITSLKKLGWECSLWRSETMLFIYPPNEKPKILQYSDEF